MKVDNEVVASVADLAKLKVDEADTAEYALSMSRILSLAEALQEVDTTDVEPLSHPLETTQRLREDKVTEEHDREELQKVAPNAEDGLYLVPRVVE